MKLSIRALIYGALVAFALCFLGIRFTQKSDSLPSDHNHKISVSERKGSTLVTHEQVSCQSWHARNDTRRANALAKLNLKTDITSKATENSDKRKKSFTDIFKKKIWGGQKNTSNKSDSIIGSGPGSTMKITENVRKTLDVVIEQVKFVLGKGRIRMLDIPCGDLTWMSEFIKDRKDIEYYGMDIVPNIIEHHQRMYTTAYPHMKFINQDVVDEPLHAKFDLIHTRQMTQHLTAIDTLKVLQNVVASGSHFLMATTVPTALERDLDHFNRGRHRLQNLEIPPYSLPPPICKQQDVSVEYNAVWLLNDLDW